MTVIDELRDVPPARDDDGFGALRTERGNLPLHRLDLRATIAGLSAGIELVQGFHNPHDVPLEATYVFPLPDRAALTGLRMTAGDRVIEGVLEERSAARQHYDEAVAAGRRASIAEEERPDVFSLRVGNILPGERVTVALTLAGPLAFTDGQAEFRFPLVVAPRYMPGVPLPGAPVGDGWAPDTDAVPDASRITPPVLLPGFPNPVDLAIEVRLDPAGLPCRRVASTLHTVTETDGVLRVRPGERVDRDFVLRLDYGADAAITQAATAAGLPAGTPAALTLAPDPAADGPAEGTYQLTVLPPEPAAPPRPKDLVLLLDRSGSMGGWKMVAARRAAARIIDTLTDRDRFTVLTFDHQIDRAEGLPAGLAAATDRHRYRAVEHLAGTEARGGTELLAPLREGLGLLTDPARARVLVLVTDGQVGNEDELLRAVASGAGEVRIHSVGIDRAVNAGFLGRLASFGGGRCELVESEDRLDEAMANIHRRVAAPLVTGVRVHADGLEFVDGTAAPARVPDLFPGVPLVVTGRYRGPAAGTVTVTGTDRDGGAWRVECAATVVDSPAARAIWARAHLRDIEDRYAVVGGDDLEREIVATSLRFGVMCRFTAYVAVDPRTVTDGGPGHRVIQPVEMPSGWAPPAPARGAAFSTMAMPLSAHAPAPDAAPAPGGAQFGTARSAPMAKAGGAPVAGARHAMRMGRGAGPADGSGPAGENTAVRTTADLAGREARALRAAAGEPPMRRAELLDDLGTRLAAQAAWLRSGPLAETLRALVTVLRDGSLPLGERWERALAVLDGLAAERPADALSERPAQPANPPGEPGDGGSGGERRRGAFWRW